MPTLGTYFNYPQDFLIDEVILRKITDVIVKHTELLNYETTMEFKVYKSDGSFVALSSVDEVLEDDNSPRKRVTRLLIDVNKKGNNSELDGSEVFSLDLDTNHASSVYFEVSEKNRGWSTLFVDDLRAQISRILCGKFWFLLQHAVAQSLIYGLLSVLISVLCFIYLPIELIESAFGVPKASLTMFDFRLTSLVVSCTLLIFMIDVFSILRPIDELIKLFGKSTFYWGDEIKRYDSRKTFKKNFLWVVLIGFAVSAFASWWVSSGS